MIQPFGINVATSGKPMNNKSKLLDSIKQSAKAIAEATESTTLLVPSGSTLLNLACSGSTAGAYKVGKIVNIIGDSSAGKSIEGFTLLAECANNPAFDKHELIYDDVESANSFNLEYLFGEKAAKRGIRAGMGRGCRKGSQEDYFRGAL